MIDYTRNSLGDTSADDVLEFVRFIESRSGGRIKLSPEAAEDCILIIGAVGAKDVLNRRHPLGVSNLDLARLGRAQAAHEAAANITLSVATGLQRGMAESETHAEQLRSIAKLVSADIPAVDAVYATRRVLAGAPE